MSFIKKYNLKYWVIDSHLIKAESIGLIWLIDKIIIKQKAVQKVMKPWITLRYWIFKRWICRSFFTLGIFISQWISHCSAVVSGVIRMKFVFRIKRRSTWKCFDFTVRKTPAILFLILLKSFGSMVISQTNNEASHSSGYPCSELNTGVPQKCIHMLRDVMYVLLVEVALNYSSNV